MSVKSKAEIEVAEFFAKYPLTTFPKKSVIIHAGSEPRAIFYIASGTIRQYDIAPSGSEVVVNVFKPPAFFPMSYAINDTPNQYFFETQTKVTLREAPVVDVINFIKSNPTVMYDLLARVFSGVDGLLRRSAHLMGGSARNRLIFELIISADRYGKHTPQGISVSLKESDLAKHTGMARETVNRLAKKLKADGLILVSRTGFLIPCIHSLEKQLGNKL